MDDCRPFNDKNRYTATSRDGRTEWMAQSAPLREASRVKKMNDRSYIFYLNKITHYFTIK